MTYQPAQCRGFPLTMSLSREGRGNALPTGTRGLPLPIRIRWRDADAKKGKLAEASLPGEGWGEGASQPPACGEVTNLKRKHNKLHSGYPGSLE
jgi:hypothetical protein